MRFPKETRALIHEAAPHVVTIPWPAGSEPKEGGIYWVQSAEDAEAERKRREHSPDTCSEVLAGMHRRHYGEDPPTQRKRRRPTRGPLAGSERIRVIATEVQEIGWTALVELYEDPDPVRHLRVKAKVPAGPNPVDGFAEPTEVEPEQLPPIRSRQERLEAEEAMRIAHEASVDRASVFRAERKLIAQRRKGKRSKLAEEAVQRAKRRAAENPSDRAA